MATLRLCGRCGTRSLPGASRPPCRTSQNDVEWDGTNLPDGRVGKGHQAAVDHVARWGDAWDEWTVDVEQIRAVQGEKELVFIRERGRSSSGLEMDERHAELYTGSDSKVVGRVGFSTRVTRSPKLPVEVAPQTRSNCEPLTRRRGLLA